MQQGSFRFPDNCPDADCNFLVTYQGSGFGRVVFELRGRGDWAGVGFSHDNQMVSNLSLQNRLNICKGGRKDGRLTRVISKLLESINKN